MLLLLFNSQPVVSVTRMTLDFCQDVIIDSAVDPDMFDWLSGNGKVTFLLSQSKVNPDRYSVKLTVFDTGNTNGIV